MVKRKSRRKSYRIKSKNKSRKVTTKSKSRRKSKRKSKKKEISQGKSRATVFIFYNYDGKESWRYRTLPKKWVWTGSGGTSSNAYPAEEQFDGPIQNRSDMREYLKKFFTKLKKKGIVKKFKIRNKYDP